MHYIDYAEFFFQNHERASKSSFSGETIRFMRGWATLLLQPRETMSFPAPIASTCIRTGAMMREFIALVFAASHLRVWGDLKRECRCYIRRSENCRQPTSGRLLERADLHAEVPLVNFRNHSRARRMKGERFRRSSCPPYAAMSPRHGQAAQGRIWC